RSPRTRDGDVCWPCPFGQRSGSARYKPGARSAADQAVERTAVVILGQVLDADELAGEVVATAHRQGRRELLAGVGTAGHRDRLDARRPVDVTAEVVLAA